MNNLIKTIDDLFQNYIDAIVSEMNCDRDSLNTLLENTLNPTNDSIVKKTECIQTPTSNPTPTLNTCPYIFTKGLNASKQCGAKPKNGLLYCSKHKSYEGKSPKQIKKGIPKPKKTSPSENIKRHHPKLNVWYHVSSKLTFKSKDEQIVVGRIVGGKIQPLIKSDIPICKKYHFKYQDNEESSSEDEESDEESSSEEESDEESSSEEEESDEEEEDKKIVKNIKKKVKKVLK